jgi:membrane protein
MRSGNAFDGLTPRHIGQLAVRSAREFSDDGCTQMAAAISYYVLFSLFPLMILAVGVTGLLLQDSQFQDDLIDFLQDQLPVDSGGEEDIADQVSAVAGVGSGALGLFGLLGMAWAGSGMFGVIRRSLNRAFDIEAGRPFVRQKLVDFAMMAVLGLLFLASITATGILRLARAATDDVPVAGDLATEIGFAWDITSFLLPVALSWMAFFLLYWLVPTKHVRKREALVGAVLASVLWECAKVGFAIYVENFGNYDAVYGSLGSVIIFLFLVFISANILLLGAEVASEYPKVVAGAYDGRRAKVPTADSLTPWSIRIRRLGVTIVRSLWFRRPGHERRAP